MTTKLRIFRNTSAQLVAKILTSITTIFITALVIREYGDGFGSLIAILTYVGLFFVFTDFGINATFVKKVLHFPQREKELFKNLIGLRLVVSIIVVFAALSILSFTSHPPIVKLGIIFGSSLVVMQALFLSASGFFQAKERYDLLVVGDILGSVITLALVFLFTNSGLGLLWIVFAYVGGTFIRFFLALYMAGFRSGGFTPSFNQAIWRELFLTSIPVGLILVFSQINANVDKQVVFLARYSPELGISGERAAAVYGLAYRVFEVAIVLPTFIMNSAYPIMLQKKKEGMTELIGFAKRLGIIMAGLGLFGMVAGIALAPVAVRILAGDNLNEAISTSRILLLGFPIFFVTAVLLWLLVSLDKQKEVAMIYALAALLNLSANLYLVPRFGYNSAAVVTLLSEGVILGLSSLLLVTNLKKT